MTANSPRTWGWSGQRCHYRRNRPVLPTRVGMVRASTITPALPSRSPHACGDGPVLEVIGGEVGMFSPRCGDGPACLFSLVFCMSFSPLSWGWSLLHSRIEEWPRCSPHLRGDDPCGSLTQTGPFVRGHFMGISVRELRMFRKLNAVESISWLFTISIGGSSGTRAYCMGRRPRTPVLGFTMLPSGADPHSVSLCLCVSVVKMVLVNRNAE